MYQHLTEYTGLYLLYEFIVRKPLPYTLKTTHDVKIQSSQYLYPQCTVRQNSVYER